VVNWTENVLTRLRDDSIGLVAELCGQLSMAT